MQVWNMTSVLLLQAENGIRAFSLSRGLGNLYMRQLPASLAVLTLPPWPCSPCLLGRAHPASLAVLCLSYTSVAADE